MSDREAEVQALERELRQRDVELAVINEIGAALGRQLGFDAIVELVGEHLRQIFETRSVAIGFVDAQANLIRWSYEVEEGRRIHSEPMPATSGLTRLVLESRAPVNVGTLEDSEARGVVFLGHVRHESFLGVPIVAGNEIIGVIDLESLERDAFDDADVRLLSTLASSMGVALANARLFDETLEY